MERKVDKQVVVYVRKKLRETNIVFIMEDGAMALCDA